MNSCCEKKDNMDTICHEYKNEIAQAMSLENVQLTLCDKDNLPGTSMQETSQLNHQDYQTLQNTNHSDHNMLTNANVLHENKSLNLPSFSQNEEQTLNMEAIANGSSSLSFDQHFYNNVNQSSIMVYEVPHGTIVPFESLVSVPLSRSNDKMNDMPIIPSSSVHKASSNQMYHITESTKYKRHDDKLLVGQIYPEDHGNIILETNTAYDRNEKFEIGLADQLNTDFSMPIENVQYAVSSEMNQICIPGGYHASNDTDSEVALTLASLGNLKSHTDTDGIYNTFCEVQEMNPINVEEPIKKSKISKSTLCLRSRKAKAPNDAKEKDNKPARKKLKNKVDKKVTKSNDRQSTAETQVSPSRDNLLGQLLKASEHCEPASLIPEGVVADVIPAVGYRIMDMCNLSEMIRMMHHCSGNQQASIVIQEQASLREGAVSQLSIICTGCQEGTVCATSGKVSSASWDINARVEQLRKEFDILEDQLCRMLEILGIFYRPISAQPPDPPNPPVQEQPVEGENTEKRTTAAKVKPKKRGKNNQEKKVECTTCGERFESPNHLKSHMRSHNVSLHVCPYCQAYFKKCYNLKEHIKKHENVKYECNFCHKKYTDKSTLSKHTLSQHEKRLKIECKICSKRFYHRNHYNEHQRMHTKEKPYSCEICGNRFSYHDSVKKHMKIHVATSRYKCRLCGKLFRWQLGLRHHLVLQHKFKKNDVEAQLLLSSVAEPVLEPNKSSNESYLDKLLDTSVAAMEKPVPTQQPCNILPRMNDRNEECGQPSNSHKPFLYQVSLDDEMFFP